jgi:methionine biosynthesis protein MetW
MKSYIKEWRNIFITPKFSVNSVMDRSYGKYWQKKSKFGGATLNKYQADRFHIFRNLLLEGPVDVVDLGCGDGVITRLLAALDGVNVWCADISDECLDRLRADGLRSIKFNIKKDDFSELPKVDFILMSEVLEHVENPEKVLFDALAVTRKGVIFSVPNTGYYKHRLRLLFGRFPYQWKITPGEHLRFWTLRDMRWWLDCLNLSGCSRLIPCTSRVGGLFPNIFSRGMVVVVRKP